MLRLDHYHDPYPAQRDGAFSIQPQADQFAVMAFHLALTRVASGFNRERVASITARYRRGAIR